MTSLGETLRRERQRRNLDLDQISRELKISSRFLEAIEEERFDRLPAPVFAKSFVRQYATLLELDAEELVADVQRRVAPEPPPGQPLTPPHESLGSVEELHLPRVEEWESVGDRRSWSSSLPALAMVVAVMIVCSGVYAFWQRARHPATPQEAPRTAAVVPPAMQPPPPGPGAGAPPVANAPAPAAAAAPAAGSGEPHPGEATAAEPAAAQAQRAGTPAAPVAAQTATATPAAPQPNPVPTAAPPNAAAPSTAAPATTPGAAAATADANRTDPNAPAATPAKGPVKIEITANEPVWVMARSNGKYIFSGTIDANQTKSVEADGTLLLRVGNAGGLTINFNGKTINNLGPKGQVRDVQFTSGGFQIVAAPKPPSAPPAPGEPR